MKDMVVETREVMLPGNSATAVVANFTMPCVLCGGDASVAFQLIQAHSDNDGTGPGVMPFCDDCFPGEHRKEMRHE